MSNLLYIEVAEQLQRDMNDKRMKPGTFLPSERVLAAQYHVSRNVIRQALSHLTKNHIVDLIPNRGTVVSYHGDARIIETIQQMLLVNQNSFLDALEVREALELAIIKKCIPYVTDEFLEEMEESWRQMEVYRQAKRVEAFVRGDVSFHERIAQLLPNPMFHTLLRSVFLENPLLFDLTRAKETVFDDTQREHRMILDGLKHKDENMAQWALCVQIKNIRKDLSSLVSQANET